jgi:hypothetical protein
VMCAVAPLGLNNGATDPWLPGSQVDPLVALAWILPVNFALYPEEGNTPTLPTA